MLILALYQSLLHKAVLTHNTFEEATIGNHKEFWDRLSEVASDSNQHEISKFWARMIPFLNVFFAYYIAVRSGNWVLQNSAIKSLIPLFFAYNHYNYEQVATTAIFDAMTFPSKMLGRAQDPRANGAWLSNFSTERSMKCLS